MQLFDYDGLRREQQERRDSGDPVQLGIGISTFTEMCGLAPSRVLGSLRYAAGGWEHGAIRMLPTGKVEVITGSSAARPGPRDGVEPDRRRPAGRAVRGRRGAPRRHAVLAQGHGHLRLALAGGRRDRDRQGGREGDREGQADRRAHAGVLARTTWSSRRASSPSRAPSKSTGIQDIAFAVFSAHDLPDGVEPTLDSEAVFDPENFSFPHGTHLCATEVDTETGRVTLRSYVCVDDIGVVVNPMIVEGQVHGGLAQGIAQALYEEAVLRRERHADDRHVRRLPAPVGGRPAVVHHRPHRDARRRRTRWASRASARRAPSRPRRPWSTPSSTRCATSA